MDSLVKARNHHKGRLLKLQTAVNKNDVTPLDPLDVQVYLKNLSIIEKQVQEIQDKIIPLCADDAAVDAQVEVSDWFDTKVTEIEVKLLKIQESLQPAIPVPVPVNPNSQVKLPTIELPSFDGQYENWQSFQDLFIASVENNKSLSNCQKLQYLKSCVKNDAASIIKSFTVTDQNYKEAWGLLTDRYDNKRELVSVLMKKLFSQPMLKSESAVALQKLIDTTNECMRSLTVLGRPIDKCDDFIVHIVIERLDPESRREWAKSLKGSEPPTVKMLQEFCDHHIRGLSASGNQVKGNVSAPKTVQFSGVDRRQVSSHHVTFEEPCPDCGQRHPIFRCNKFNLRSTADKMNFVKTNLLCFNCLKAGHSVQQCTSNQTCKRCNRYHHSLLHFEATQRNEQVTQRNSETTTNRAQQQRPAPASQSTNCNTSSNLSFFEEESTQVLLKTALGNVADHDGHDQVCRLFLDDGSKASLVTEECVRRLGLKKRRCHVIIRGVSSVKACVAKSRVTLNIKSLHIQTGIVVEALVVPVCTDNLPTYPCDPRQWDHISSLQLADSSFHIPGGIDILIGGDVTASLLIDGIRHGPRLTPIAQNTVFGWVMSGRINSIVPEQVSVNHANCDVEAILHKFWELEELPTIKHLTEEEKLCENHFIDTHSRQNDGRYVVQLPFKTCKSQLGSSRDQAVNRLIALERRFKKDPTYKDDYIKFMRDYESLQHMETVPLEFINKSSAYYLPHHYVLKDDSTTTKFRVVFDGSAKTSTGISLNNALMVGPTVQDDLFTILLRFRHNLIALKADITKMYRQFKVNEEDADYQRIVWRESSNDPIMDYRLTTVTYGTASAPFSATRCLQQLGKDESIDYPRAAQAIMNDLYVDDLMSGESTPAKAIQLQKELSAIIERGKMKFCKWGTNDPTVLASISEELRESDISLDFDSDSSIKALGVRWIPSIDQCVFTNCDFGYKEKVTKRKLLSELAKVFDPFGWLSPTTIQAKLMLQELWKSKTGWDEYVDECTQVRWQAYREQLKSISNLKIPRCIIAPQTIKQELHGFGDASEKAYAAVVYLRCTKSDGTIQVTIVAAKTKVAPMKQVSIPRLELCGSLLLSELIDKIRCALKIDKSNVFAWTDSTIVLSWLASYPGRWTTFVANRVAKIQDLIPYEKWQHVISEDNPADSASRGIVADELINSTLWWKGPVWLQEQIIPSPVFKADNKSVLPEEKQSKLSVSVCHVIIEPSLISRYDSLKKLKRVTAYCLRYIHNVKSKPADRRGGVLTTNELQQALFYWIRVVQSSEFTADISSLQSKNQVPPKSKLRQLFPFIDSSGLLRVGGRLQNANVPEPQKHQIILPHDDHLTLLIIRDYHETNLHSGFQLTFSSLRSKYWILKGRDTVRHYVRKCVVCRRQRATTTEQLMGNLPSARVNPGRPFLSSGVDFAGPFNLKPFKGRTNKTFKCYFSIFVCLATKAVHLEAVSELSTDAFIAAFKRFISRRGLPSDMYSDCGTNFVGADKELQKLTTSKLYQETIASQLTHQGVNWHFNSPAAPHQGGLWEAGVKAVKYHLRRVIGPTALTLDEFMTVLCQIEACLNSRPLCAMSSDPTDLGALTPGHFIIGSPMNAIPEPDLTTVKVNRLSRWQLTQQMTQHFWKRWSNEYLSTLQQRFKWTAKRTNLEIGDLVIIKDETMPQTKWKLGRIVETHPGADSCVRVVTLMIQTGLLKRPIAKLCPLILQSDN